MIDTAYVMGQIGKAIYQEDGRYFVVGAQSPNEPLECRSGDISLLLDCSTDVLSISWQDLSLSRIKDILAERTLCHKALTLVLSGLDEELSLSNRSISIEAVENLLEQEAVLRFLRARMLARVLPDEADLPGALSLANASGATRVASLYVDVKQTQKGIKRLTEAWSETSLLLSLTDAEKVEIESSLIDAGVFADIAFTIAVGDEVRVKSTITNWAAKSEVSSQSRHSQILNALQDRLLGESEASVMPRNRIADRSRAIEAALLNIEKRFGKGSIMRLGEREISDIPAISTTSLSLDAAIGVGGVPRGRIVEIYGPESSGKTTLALHVVAEAQKAGGVAAYIDAEHAMDADYAGKLGVNIDDLLISQPDSGEQALEIGEALVRSNGVDVIVVDSVAALVPRAELDGEMGDSLPGLQARLMSQALRKLTALVAQSNTCFIFINQIREKIGVMFGNPETTTGGRALKFYSSLRLDIRRIGAIKDGDRVVGNRTKVKVAKNKVAPPFRECEFDIMYGEGISREGDVLDLASNNRVVEKSGAWFSYKGERLGQGRENAKQTLRDNPDVLKRIENEVKRALGMLVRRESRTEEALLSVEQKKAAIASVPGSLGSTPTKP